MSKTTLEDWADEVRPIKHAVGDSFIPRISCRFTGRPLPRNTSAGIIGIMVKHKRTVE